MDSRPRQRLAVHPQVLWRRVDDEAVLLHTGSGKYFTLDGVGTRLWELLIDEQGDVERVIDRFVSEYAVAPAKLRSDLVAFVDELLRSGLVETRDASSDENDDDDA